LQMSANITAASIWVVVGMVGSGPLGEEPQWAQPHDKP